MNGVIYARYSSHNQREESIEGQVRKCRAFAERHDINIIGEYIDRALSGKTDKRENFQRMIRDSEKGKFQAIIMYTMDRFARNRYDSAHYKAKLKKNGVRLYYTEQTITDEPEGIILESVLEGMAEYYSENLSRGVKRGMRENALQCKTTGGYMPLGYRKSTDNRYEIDPSTAPIVREIFDLYANGKTQRQVVDILNKKGYRTVKGNTFKITSLHSILTNKRYTGTYYFDDVSIANGIPAIVDSITFDKVQRMLSKNKRKSGRMKAPVSYLLSSKLYCGQCGAAMIGESGTSRNGNIYNYYKCGNRKRHKSCNKENEKKDWLEKLVVEKTIAKMLSPGVIDEIAENVVKIAEKENADASRLKALKKELADTQNSIRNLLRLVEKGIDTDDVGERLLDLNALKVDLQTQIATKELSKPQFNKERISYWLNDLLKNGCIDNEEYRQRIIDTLINKIYVFDADNGGKRITVICNTSKNSEIDITLSDIKSFVEANKCSDINGFAPP